MSEPTKDEATLERVVADSIQDWIGHVDDIYPQACKTLAAIRAAGWAVVPGWQPIETAPTDGSAALLWPYAYSSIWQGTAEAEVVLGYFDSEGREEWFNPEQGDWFDPTHWMPLPAAPGVKP